MTGRGQWRGGIAEKQMCKKTTRTHKNPCTKQREGGEGEGGGEEGVGGGGGGVGGGGGLCVCVVGCVGEMWRKTQLDCFYHYPADVHTNSISHTHTETERQRKRETERDTHTHTHTRRAVESVCIRRFHYGCECQLSVGDPCIQKLYKQHTHTQQ